MSQKAHVQHGEPLPLLQIPEGLGELAGTSPALSVRLLLATCIHPVQRLGIVCSLCHALKHDIKHDIKSMT